VAGCLLALGVAAPGLPGPGPARAGAAPAGAAGLLFGRPLDLNRAHPAALEALPGIGPARAAAIAAARRAEPFCRVEDLLRVPGIGPHTLAAAAAGLAVDAPPGSCGTAAGAGDAPGYRQPVDPRGSQGEDRSGARVGRDRRP
jgi:hypothetical protein